MDFTARMVALLARMRRERNGAVADAMRYYGARYGLNYGVSLPTLRRIARAECPDHDFARYLYLQDVREMRLAALHIAQADRFAAEETDAWAAGVVNSEVAEEAAFALLSRIDALPELFRAWIASERPLLAYAALLAGARSPLAGLDWADAAVATVRRYALSAETPPAAPDSPESPSARTGSARAAETPPAAPDSPESPSVRTGSALTDASPTAAYDSIPARSAARLVAQGTVALLAAVGSRNEESRQAVLRMAGSLGKLPAEDCVHEELSWRLEA